MSQNFDIAIVGAGIVGLASAWALQQRHPEKSIVIIEKESEIAKHQTGRNSGVIHSGIYYKPGSAKAKNCQRGYQLLLDFCKSRDISHEICGKVIVATNEIEQETLNGIFQRGIRNGLTGIKKISREELREKEPYCEGVEAISVPQAGIVNYRQVAKALCRELEGVELLFNQSVENLSITPTGVQIESQHGTVQAKFLIVTAGAYADRLARQLRPELDFRIIPFRGEYYELNSPHFVRNLIYPVPDTRFPFLGVHLTRMIGGGIEAGPNAVLALSREGYRWSDINLKDCYETWTWPGFLRIAANHWRMGLGELHRSVSKKAFTKALNRLVPDLTPADLRPAVSGVRAQACHRNGLIDDYWIERDKNYILVLNAPSPAATSCLAIGETIATQASAIISKN